MAQAAPQFGAVVIFLCCVALAVTGVGILFAGIKACHIRLMQLPQFHWSAPVAYARGGLRHVRGGGMSGGVDPYDDERD